jgi:CRP/FNR family transcriptional regulator, LitR-dependent transcriptional activator
MNEFIPDSLRSNSLRTAPQLRVSKGSPVYLEGDPSESLFRLTAGMARVTKLSPNGRTVVVRHVLPGDYFGEESLNSQIHTVEAHALTDLTLEMLSPAVTDPSMLIQVTKNLSEQLARIMKFETHLQLGELPERIARYLLELLRTPLCETDALGRQSLRISQEVIAQGVNGTRESTAKILKQLRQAGLIEIEYRRTILIDLAGLQRFAVGQTK